MKEFTMSNDEDNKSTFIVIADTRIKLSNIKQYGVSNRREDGGPLGDYNIKKYPNPNPKPKFKLGNIWKWLDYDQLLKKCEQDKRLYITTFQRDNFSFLKSELHDDFERVLKQLDDYFT